MCGLDRLNGSSRSRAGTRAARTRHHTHGKERGRKKETYGLLRSRYKICCWCKYKSPLATCSATWRPLRRSSARRCMPRSMATVTPAMLGERAADGRAGALGLTSPAKQAHLTPKEEGLPSARTSGTSPTAAPPRQQAGPPSVPSKGLPHPQAPSAAPHAPLQHEAGAGKVGACVCMCGGVGLGGVRATVAAATAAAAVTAGLAMVGGCCIDSQQRSPAAGSALLPACCIRSCPPVTLTPKNWTM